MYVSTFLVKKNIVGTTIIFLAIYFNPDAFIARFTHIDF